MKFAILVFAFLTPYFAQAATHTCKVQVVVDHYNKDGQKMSSEVGPFLAPFNADVGSNYQFNLLGENNRIIGFASVYVDEIPVFGADAFKVNLNFDLDGVPNSMNLDLVLSADSRIGIAAAPYAAVFATENITYNMTLMCERI